MRFRWSVVVYTLGTLVLVPGIIKVSVSIVNHDLLVLLLLLEEFACCVFGSNFCVHVDCQTPVTLIISHPSQLL